MSFTLQQAHETAIAFSGKTAQLLRELIPLSSNTPEERILKKQLKHEERLLKKLQGICTREAEKETSFEGPELTATAFLKMHLARRNARELHPDPLTTALELRKDSLLLFTELWSGCPYEDSRKMLQELIHEEKKMLLELIEANGI